eukprot:5558938-Prymnesium_polylepis.1
MGSIASNRHAYETHTHTRGAPTRHTDEAHRRGTQRARRTYTRTRGTRTRTKGHLDLHEGVGPLEACEGVAADAAADHGADEAEDDPVPVAGVLHVHVDLQQDLREDPRGLEHL